MLTRCLGRLAIRIDQLAQRICDDIEPGIRPRQMTWRPIALSSEVDTGSREESASNKKPEEAPVLIPSEPKRL
jgi:hypothetical protein